MPANRINPVSRQALIYYGESAYADLIARAPIRALTDDRFWMVVYRAIVDGERNIDAVLARYTSSQAHANRGEAVRELSQYCAYVQPRPRDRRLYEGAMIPHNLSVLGKRMDANATRLLAGMDAGQTVTMDDVEEFCALPATLRRAIADEQAERKDVR